MNLKRGPIILPCLAPTLSYCVVNTNGREYLLACLAAIERTHPAGIEHEILVLDNASSDGSAEAGQRGGGGGAAVGGRHPPARAGAAGRQGGKRLDSDGRGAGPLLPAAERGLGAASGSERGAGRGA